MKKINDSKEVDRLRNILIKENEEICQMVGQTLDYPWYMNDKKNFPDATESDGVCFGEHTSITIVSELIKKYKKLKELDAEAATHVESQIVMFERFTGEPPYVGWKGVGLALKEELEAKDKHIKELEQAANQIKELEEILEKIIDIKWRDGLRHLDNPTDFAEREAALDALSDVKTYAKSALKTIRGDKPHSLVGGKNDRT